MSTPAQLAQAAFLQAAFLTDPRVQAILAMLNSDGEAARVIGGAVRNALLGLPVADIDICTTALPGIVTTRAQAAGFKTVPIGIAHGTVTVIIDAMAFEVTTLRQDIATDGRHATVSFGRDFAADALRRDFTINALGLDTDGRLHDYCGGLEDLAARRVRFIGDAGQRIAEDYLRILRFFRFHATFGHGDLDRAGLEACIAGRAGLAQLSRERIRSEVRKLLAARRGPQAAAAMSDAGLLGLLTGGAPYVARLARLAAIEAARDAPADPVARLAGLALMTAQDAQRLADRLRLSHAEATRLTVAAHALPAFLEAAGPPPYGRLRELLFAHKRQGAQDGLLLAHAVRAAAPDDPAFTGAWRFLRDTPEPRLPFGGVDLLARGMAGGKAVGEVLKRLQASWIRAGFPHDPATLARLLDGAMHPPD